MSEEIVNTEKFIIRMLEHSIDTYIEGTKVTKVELTTEQAQVLLDLYNKQKEEIQSLENQLDFIGEQNKYIDKLETRLSNQEKIIEGQEEWIKDFKLKTTFKFFDEEYISKDKIRDKIKEYDKKLDKLAEKEHNWNKMNEIQQMEHQLLKNRYTNYHNVLNELLEEK